MKALFATIALATSVLNSNAVVNQQTINLGDGLDANTELRSSENITNFSLLAKTSNNKVIDCLDGYAYSQTWYYTAPYTNNSDLLLIHTRTEFVPGCVAYGNGDTEYDKSRKLSWGYVHINLEQYTDTNKNAYGGLIEPIARWPMSSSVTTTVTSSFGTEFNVGFNQNTEISIGTDMSIKSSKGNKVGLTISYDKSVSSTSEDPTLSSQTGAESNLDYQWNWDIVNPDMTGSLTYTLDTYALFELDNSYKNCGRYAYVYTYEVRFVSQYKFLWWWNDGSIYDNAIRITCFA